MSAAVRLRGVHRGYGSNPVLLGVDLEVAEGDVVAVLGPNGSGKTTLVRVLAGLLRPSSGSAEVLGRAPGDPVVRRRTGLLGHTPLVYGRLTALENVRFWARMHDADDAGRWGAELLRRLGLDPADDRTVSAYSQGMRQRTALACALAHDPDLVLADEPFSGLDAAGTDAVASLLGSGRRTLVLATHEAGRVRDLGARLLRLEAGRLHEVRA